jgi:Transcriptional regulator PadR-like family
MYEWRYPLAVAAKGHGQAFSIRFPAILIYILHGSIIYCSMSFNRDLNKGSAELLVLTLLEGRPRHGYDIGKLIEERSNGQIRFRIGSLYPILSLANC